MTDCLGIVTTKGREGLRFAGRRFDQVILPEDGRSHRGTGSIVTSAVFISQRSSAAARDRRRFGLSRPIPYHAPASSATRCGRSRKRLPRSARGHFKLQRTAARRACSRRSANPLPDLSAGNPCSTDDSPYLQSEVKYGAPILDRGTRRDVSRSGQYAMLSFRRYLRRM